VVAAGFAAHAWLDRKNDVLALRAALGAYWPRRGLTGEMMPLLTGCAALSLAEPLAIETFLPNFFAALAEEAAAGFALFRMMDGEWRQARVAVARRRSDFPRRGRARHFGRSTHCLGKALASTLGMAVNNATHLLDGLVTENLIVEVYWPAKAAPLWPAACGGLRQAIPRPRPEATKRRMDWFLNCGPSPFLRLA
jgi:hypothetical protein